MSANEGFHLRSFVLNGCVGLKLKTFDKAFGQAEFLGDGSVDKLKMFVLFFDFDLIFLENFNLIFKFFDLFHFFFIAED